MSPSPSLSGQQRTPNPCAWLGSRRFAPLFVAQSLGAFNDGLVAAALVALLTVPAASPMAFRPESAAAIALVVFLLPFLLCSATAGELADKDDRASLARRIKLVELLVMGVATLGFLLSSATILTAALFLLGLRAALLAPASLALLPQQLRERQLVGANALLHVGLLAALLTGALFGVQLGALLIDQPERPTWCTWLGLVVAAAGFLASRIIPAAPAPDPELAVGANPGALTLRQLALARQDRALFMAIVGVAWFGFCVAAWLAGVTPDVVDAISGKASSAIVALLVVSFGFAIGSLLCQALSGQRLEVGLIPLSALGLALVLLDLASADRSTAQRLDGSWRALVDLGAIGVLCGIHLVALNVLIESQSPPQQRARVVAAALALAALATLAGWIVGAASLANELALTWSLALAALGFAAIAAYAYWAAPHLCLRFAAALLIHFFYRLDKTGFEHIPETGPAVLVCNHVSFVDSVVIMAAVRRPIRFVMDYHIHRTPGVGFIFRHSQTIPIATAKENLALKETAFAAVAHALKNGELIGLFPEGRITHSGEINHFRYGVGRIVSETPVPVIPMALRGLWGSFFSRRYGPAMSKPSLLRPCAKIELVVGEPVPPQRASPEYLQEIVTELRGGLV